MGHTKYVTPRRFGTDGSVRAMRIPYRACWANDVQIFWPLTIHSSPSGSARVARLAKSLPASGSLKS